MIHVRIIPHQNAADHTGFYCCWDYSKRYRRQDEGYSPTKLFYQHSTSQLFFMSRFTLFVTDRTRQASRLPRKAEFKVEIEPMLEHLARDLADSTLAHIREDDV